MSTALLFLEMNFYDFTMNMIQNTRVPRFFSRPDDRKSLKHDLFPR